MLLMAGCSGSSAHDVPGTIKIDGKPLNSGSITFVDSQGKSIVANINRDGTFAFNQLGKGTFQASVEVPKPRRMASVKTDPARPPRPQPVQIPAHYFKVESAGLNYTVDDATGEINIELSGKTAAR